MSILIGIMFFIYSIKTSLEEVPLSVCKVGKPFKTMNNSCANFVDVCVKTGDRECQNFQNVCQQCPASNYSILTLLEMTAISEKMLRLEKKIGSLDTFSKIGLHRNQYQLIYRIYILIYCIIIIICFILIILFVEIRFKLCTKIFKSCESRNMLVNYQILKSRKYLENDNGKWNDMSTKIENIDSRTKDITGWIEKLLAVPTVAKKEFQVVGLSKPIKLNVNLNENVIQIKQRICNRWPKAQLNYHKKMRVTLEGKVLDDNDYLLSQISSLANVLKCEVDHSMNPDDFLVINVTSNRRIPDLLQIKKDITVKEIKSIISSINKFISDPIIKELNTGKDLNDGDSLKSHDLRDSDWIKIIMRDSGLLTIKSMFDDKKSNSIKYSNFDGIENLKRNFAGNFNFDSKDLVLFLNEMELENQRYIYDYDIDLNSNLSFCHLESWRDIDIIGNSIEKDKFFQLLHGKYKDTGEEVLIKKYSLVSKIKLESQKAIINELSVFQIAQTSERFLKLLGIYHEDNALYATMEYTEIVSLLEFIKKNYNLKEMEISLFCRQILEGLQILHSNNMIHGSLRPTNIVVDRNKNIKLLYFNLSSNPYSTEECCFDYSLFPVRYSAPELLNDESYNSAVDIWSLGAVLVYIITESEPYETLSESDVVSQIKRMRRISFKYPNFPVSYELKKFLSDCLEFIPENRPNGQKLLEYPFILQFS